ncbi:DUF452 family protein [Aureibacter tunicatorum]|uniref:Biotin synthesis protein BioG n=1 Tax=Aureibacter tunicatorum TaxID=866807 RepID=A0AAE4BT86_9BACT|nr:pimeloyl-ACP methyl esterase BioG family protein [Aureibacter tunicatorum]MDR6239593.1 biotin synthesis protein BioG [Aureibacter tunicatorum]BDD04070.1 biotin synthase [Aureibacter tunicatorum]
MTTNWITKDSNNLIIFFNGWGMDISPFKHLHSNDFDLLHIFDYSDSNHQDMIDERRINEYKNVVLISWSLGVWKSNQFLNHNKGVRCDKKIAINGTLQPINDQFGIPEKIFLGTLENLNERNLLKFRKRMCFKSPGETFFFEHLPTREFENVKTELKELFDDIKSESNVFANFDKAVISENDLIIPSNNQHSFWDGKTDIITLNDSHYPFHLWKSWDEIALL